MTNNLELLYLISFAGVLAVAYRGHEKFYFSDPTSDITSNRPLAATEDKTATTATAVHRRTRV